MRAPRCPGGILTVLLLSYGSLAAATWEQITVNSDLLTQLFGANAVLADGRPGFEDADGVTRIPGCSEALVPIRGPDGSPVVGPDGIPVVVQPPPELARFAFFVDRGSSRNRRKDRDLLIYFAGGGACWDATTCVGTLVEQGAQPTYFPQFFETTEALDHYSNDTVPGAGGILTRVRRDNPYADFTKVYIPYCTGDVHIGSRDVEYEYLYLSDDGLTQATLQPTIRHRGFDNLLVVLKWLQLNVAGGLGPNSEVTVAGSSAGGYAAPIAFPEIRDHLGDDPDYSIIVDSANGVFTNGFLDQALGGPADPGVWGARGNVPQSLQQVLDLDADVLWTRVLQTIGHAYSDTRVSHSTAAYDGVQALILHFMQRVDTGQFPTPDVSLQTVFEWSLKARASMLTTAFSVPNYRRYLAAGAGHIHLLDPPPDLVRFPTSSYFDENSARRVYFTDWLDDMLNNPRLFFRTDWRNLSCFPNCLP